MRRPAEVAALVQTTTDRYGRLDCAVNNAGLVGRRAVPVAEIEESLWDQVLTTNLKAVWTCMKYEIPAMLRQGRGGEREHLVHLWLQGEQ